MFNKMPVSIITFFIICLLILIMYDHENPLSMIDEEHIDEDQSVFVLRTDTLNINDKKTLQYIGLMINADNTLNAAGGFFEPKEQNPQTIHNMITNTDLNYKIVIEADHGQYKVLPITKDFRKKILFSEIYGKKYIEKTGDEKFFYIHIYDGYKKSFDSPVVDGVLMSLIDTKKNIVTVKGKITVDLNNEENGKFIVYFGDQKQEKGGIILGKNDIVKSGKMVIQYGSQVKKYLINNRMSSDDKKKLNLLNFFTIP